MDLIFVGWVAERVEKLIRFKKEEDFVEDLIFTATHQISGIAVIVWWVGPSILRSVKWIFICEVLYIGR
jgi:hypothetical protein